MARFAPDAIECDEGRAAALMAQSGGSNLSEVMWLKSEIAAADARLALPA